MPVFHMIDIIPLIGLPYPNGRMSYNVACPVCDNKPNRKHLNINLKKDVFRCPRCGFSGGVFDLYSFYSGIPRNKVKDAITSRLSVYGWNYNSQKTVNISNIPEIPIADIDIRHKVYTILLSTLSLSSDHRNSLNNRGLSDAMIDKLEYKTTPVFGEELIAKKLIESGVELLGVPGFYKSDSGSWTFSKIDRGIFIPVRDMEGRIQGLQIRRDNVGKGKFRWFSSNGKRDGCKAQGWVHVSGTMQPTILLTEGPMKADIIHLLGGYTVLSVPGVNTLTHLKTVLKQLQKLQVTKIMTAFDMDFLNNPHVQNGYNNLIHLFDELGLKYGTYLWNPKYKGLDDYIWQCLISSTKK